MSMKVEKSTLDQVKRRFAAAQEKKQEEKKHYGNREREREREEWLMMFNFLDFEERMKELHEEVQAHFVDWLV